MRLARLAIGFSLLAWILLLIGGPGYRLDLWGLGFGLLGVMRYALILGMVGAAVALVLLVIPRIRSESALMLGIALILGVTAAAVPLQVRNIASSVPPIHDISTDLDDPPAFVAVLPLRADAPNPPEYAGPEVAEQQRNAYPDLTTLRLERSPEASFEAALAAVEALGWEQVAAVPSEGRIEAVDTTLWYGFRDDVVIRIRADGSGSLVDVRSKSRVGVSDLGANAGRIREFLDRLQ